MKYPKISSNKFKHYDKIYHDKDYLKEARFICSLLKQLDFNTEELLEFGSGSSKLSIILAETFSKITCIDSNKSMLEYAHMNLSKVAKELASKIELVEENLLDLSLGRRFDLIISIFHVICYFNSNKDLNSFFKTSALHLKKNGLLIFDYWNGPAVIHQKPTNTIKNIDHENFRITRNGISKLDTFKSLVNVKYKIEYQQESKPIETYFEEHSMRYLFPNEIDFYAEINGFEVLKHSTWLKDRIPTIEDWSAFSILRRK